jgi:hypothetical protein
MIDTKNSLISLPYDFTDCAGFIPKEIAKKHQNIIHYAPTPQASLHCLLMLGIVAKKPCFVPLLCLRRNKYEIVEKGGSK